MKIEGAINQPVFKSGTAKAGINLLYTASWFSSELQHALKPFNITWQQFNIMRILKGQQGKPASMKLVSCRMIDGMSNTSRLVDKLVAKGFVNREVADCDRRQVAMTLTNEGMEHLKQTSAIVENLSDTVFKKLTTEQQSQLSDLLDQLRE